MNTKEELYDLFKANASDAEWEEYDFVDPPFCASASIYLEVDGYIFEGDGYIFEGDGMITYPDDKEIQELECTTPEGETISII